MSVAIFRLFSTHQTKFCNIRSRMSTFTKFVEYMPDFMWGDNPKAIITECELLIKSTTSLYDKLVQTPSACANFKNVLIPIIKHDIYYDRRRNILNFYSSVSPDKDIRDASIEVDKKLSEFEIKLSMRKDLYDLFMTVRKNETDLDYDSNRMIERLLLYKRRNGLHLDQEKRDAIQDLDHKLSSLCIDFSKNMVEENEILLFTLKELEGVDADFISGLDKDESGLFKVTLKYPHVSTILKYCQVIETRKKVEFAFNCRCINENVKILEEAISLRHKRANLLGYSTHFDFTTEILMSKCSKNVLSFLDSLKAKLKDARVIEMNRLLELKKEECSKKGVEFDGVIHAYDSSYYQRMVEERDFSVDHNLIKEYFPCEAITEKLLEIYQNLLHLKFEKIEGAKAWHPEVTLYAVYDKLVESSDPMGYFYMDLFPRDGKYSHAACFGLQDFCHVDKDHNQLPLAAMVANFTKPLPHKPSLFSHQEVETFFHEFGHVMHHICSKSKYSMFSGTSVERDFVEAPSQMLENWVWDKDCLKTISSHYKTGEPMNDEMIEKLCKSRMANSGMTYMRQVALATFDFEIHTKEKSQTSEVWNKVYSQLAGINPTPGTNFAASFGHMCGGYDSRYYGYLWSEVFSCDMFVSRFKKEGIANPQTGLSYRKCILEPGSTKDGMDLLKSFLGREPTMEPFLEISGIKKSS